MGKQLKKSQQELNSLKYSLGPIWIFKQEYAILQPHPNPS